MRGNIDVWWVVHDGGLLLLLPYLLQLHKVLFDMLYLLQDTTHWVCLCIIVVIVDNMDNNAGDNNSKYDGA